MSGSRILSYAWRTLVLIFAVFAAYQAWDYSRFYDLRYNNPAAAHAERPDDGLALELYIIDRLTSQEAFSPQQGDADMARLSLLDAPLGRAPLWVISVVAASQGDGAKAQQALLLSEAVSRRFPPAQLSLIEVKVARDDVPGVLTHYHNVLSTTPDLDNVLYPIMGQAISLEEIRDGLRPYIARQSDWAPTFMRYAASESDPSDVAALVLPISGALAGRDYDIAVARLISRLAGKGDEEGTLQAAKALIPGVAKLLKDNGGFDKESTATRLGRLGWSLETGARVHAELNGSEGINIRVASLAKGRAAARLFPVGGARQARLEYQANFDKKSNDPVIRWEGWCVSSEPDRPIWNHEVTADETSAEFGHEFAIPPNCPFVDLRLIVMENDQQSNRHIEIQEFTVDLE
jgi:hypothetical protein